MHSFPSPFPPWQSWKHDIGWSSSQSWSKRKDRAPRLTHLGLWACEWAINLDAGRTWVPLSTAWMVLTDTKLIQTHIHTCTHVRTHERFYWWIKWDALICITSQFAFINIYTIGIFPSLWVWIRYLLFTSSKISHRNGCTARLQNFLTDQPCGMIGSPDPTVAVMLSQVSFPPESPLL